MASPRVYADPSLRMRAALHRVLPLLVLAVIAVISSAVASRVAARDLEAGVAFSNPELLAELERRGFGFVALISPDWRLGEPGAMPGNATLSSHAAMRPVMATLNAEFADYIRTGGQRTGVGVQFDFRVFNRAFLSSDIARFELVGIVNRMDRGYRAPATCGEVRLIYRLAYRATRAGGTRFESRLPMTLNLVLKANPTNDAGFCAEVARRWIAAGTWTGAPATLAARLIGPAGPLSLLAPSQIDRLETNIQIRRVPAAIQPQFGGHADYLLNVFRWYPRSRVFRRQRMENQVDRARLIADPALAAAFKAWLFELGTIRDLDAGLISIPDRFLAARAVSVAPGGTARSQNRHLLGIVTDQDVTQALARIEGEARSLKNISSVAGFQQRLNDVSCVGCHQSRAIGGFHFMGADPKSYRDRVPQNSIFVPASPHFYGEMPRRRKLVEAIAAGRPPDLMRSFALRPRTGFAAGLKGSGLHNGWGAACGTSRDPSFSAWSCAAGLVCREVHGSPFEPEIGTCTTAGQASYGDPVELGRIRMIAYGRDTFERDGAAAITVAPGLRAAPQAGGFFGGMVKKTGSCRDLPSRAVCAREAAGGFNGCTLQIATSGEPFERCLSDQHTAPAGLRACDQRNPCRDDYLCIATRTPGRGACLPPYFLFQFRVDGHPTTFEGLSPLPR